MLLNKLNAFFNPEQFQGWSKKRHYFEGWYFKIVNASETKAFAFIPGIAMDNQYKKHAFIQILDGKQHTSRYYKFKFEDFVPSRGKFKISLRNSVFTEYSMGIDLPDVSGRLEFEGNVQWPKPLYSPGIMGPYAFVPFMECYHGIVSMDHTIHGKITFRGEDINFENGRGYIEKDWGKSFPSAYVWIQSNHFGQQGISLKASVAKIPWLRSSFIGFIAGVWLHDRLIRFTTYNHSVLRKLHIDKSRVELVLENPKFQLQILAQRKASAILASPIQGVMDGRIEESMTSKLEVMLTDKRNNALIFNDTGRNAGLEVAGNIDEIVTG
jgi:tocopherol cyclase